MWTFLYNVTLSLLCSAHCEICSDESVAASLQSKHKAELSAACAEQLQLEDWIICVSLSHTHDFWTHSLKQSDTAVSLRKLQATIIQQKVDTGYEDSEKFTLKLN